LTQAARLPMVRALMPVLRGAVTFSRFRVEPSPDAPPDAKRGLLRGLRARAFEPIDLRSDEDRAVGFVELEANDATGFSSGSVFQGEYALFSFRVDQIRIPGAAVKAELEKWAQAFEKENGRPPGKTEKAAQRSSIRQVLRGRAVPRTHVHDLSWNLTSNQLQIWASSRKAVEEIQTLFEAAFQVKLSPRVPAVIAAKQGILETALVPTPELVGAELHSEVSHGEA